MSESSNPVFLFQIPSRHLEASVLPREFEDQIFNFWRIKKAMGILMKIMQTVDLRRSGILSALVMDTDVCRRGQRVSTPGAGCS